MAAALAGAWLSLGCGARTAEAAFASDFNCNADVTAESSEAPGRYIVEGCGRRATYQCVSAYEQNCILQTASEDRSAPHDPPARREASRPAPAEVRVQHKDEGAVMVLELALERRALLRLTATPDKRSDLVQLKLMHGGDDDDAGSCNLDWMVNGQVIQMPKSVGGKKGSVVAHRVQIGRELITEFALAEKIALRACRQRFSLNREQVAKVRDFMERFQEEMAWQAKPRDGSTGGMVAPAGGWPDWKPSGEPAAAGKGAALDGSGLFKKLSVSVFQVEAPLAQGSSQGSAVAIGANELLTNCHVIRGAVKIIVRQGKNQWPATPLRADPATDRCVIGVKDVTLQPVAGVRSFASLEVGEPAYTLGSPVGLELTLADGIVSGTREEGGRHFVQTTAPISPGSSGGGLFDARGNLIGITTLVLAGRERLNQSLNFAIPADEFWKP